MPAATVPPFVGITPVPEGGFRVDLPATREVGVQTNELGGLSSLTHEQLSELRLYTTSGTRPGALHMFLECHSMRGFSNPILGCSAGTGGFKDVTSPAETEG